MLKKMINIRFTRKEFGKRFQKWLFSFGFTWNDGIMVLRDCGEEEYYLEINVNNGTFRKLPFFSPPDSFIELKTMEVDNPLDWHPVMKRLNEIFNKYRKPLPEIKPPAPKDKPNVKYNTLIKEKGDGMGNVYGRPMDGLMDF